jgi:hypothetical protein
VRILILVVTSALLLSGCAESQSIYHKRGLSTARPTSITVDADQRSTWIVPGIETVTAQGGGKTIVTRDWRICSEAAPDVFSANSASGSGAFSLAGLGKGGSPEGSAQGALAVAEVAASIERTQTINLLRESMYRTCERYLSGAIDRPTFVVQAARDQRTMVAVLAIEQLTRTARGPSTIIVPPKTTSTTTSNAGMDARLGAAAAAESATRSAADTANESYKTARATGKCDTVSTLPVAGNTDPTPEAWTTCQNAKADLSRADEAAKAAGERHAQLIELAKARAADSATASTETGTSSGGSVGTQGSPPTGPDLARVSAAVVEIANAPQLDETLMFCVAYMTDQAKIKDTTLPPAVQQTLNMCRRIMERRAAIDNSIVTGAAFDRASVGTSADAISLQDYVATAASDTEKTRRLGLIATAMSQLGMSGSAIDAAAMITGSDANAQTRIANRLRALEPDPALAALFD